MPLHMEQPARKGDMVIGNDVWIGRESVIMSGVKIGSGAIVAACSMLASPIALSEEIQPG